MLLVGSRAMAIHYNDYRQPKDWDWVVCEGKEECPKSQMKGDVRHEYHVLPVRAYELLEANSVNGVVNPTALYTKKLSHSFWNVHWNKTAWDIVWCQNKGLTKIPELFDILYNKWIEVHGKKHAYLKKKNEDFFKDAVDRKYVHDDLHKAVAYYERPLYEGIKADKTLALTSFSLFNKLSYEDKLRLCREEIYVTTLERFLIPSDFGMNVNIAYKRAINRLVTSMTKGWFPLFIMENLNKLDKPESVEFISKFNNALNLGLIREL